MMIKLSTNLGGGERGSASLTSVLILALLALFTAASLAKVTTEAVVMGNDYSNTKAFYAAQASRSRPDKHTKHQARYRWI